MPDGNPERIWACGVYPGWSTSNTILKNVFFNCVGLEIRAIMRNQNLDTENNLVSDTFNKNTAT